MAAHFVQTSTGRVARQRWSSFFLERLHRLVELNSCPVTLELNAEPIEGFDAERLLRMTIYSTYLDCRASGAGKEAQRILPR